MGIQPVGPNLINQQSKIVQAPKKDIDPLVKMQM